MIPGMTSSLENDVNVPSKRNKQKNSFCWHLQDPERKEQDPDPYVNGTDLRIRVHTNFCQGSTNWLHKSLSETDRKYAQVKKSNFQGI